MNFLYDEDVRQVVARHGLERNLVKAIVLIESSGDRFAWNPEPKYAYLWNVRTNKPFRPLTVQERYDQVPPHDFPHLKGDKDQEWWAQQASWGLMQTMGAVARERGFDYPYLTRLTEANLSLEYGCRHLTVLLRWSKGDVPAALAAYNGGATADNKPGVAKKRNQAYVDKVFAQYEALRRG